MIRVILILCANIAIGLLQAEDWLTIYNDDLSLVRSSFDLELNKGRQEYNFDDITSRIEPASVIVSSAKNEIIIAEQNYEYDLAGTMQIMRKYIERPISVLTKDQTLYEGTLKFFDSSTLGLVEEPGKKLVLVSYAEVQSVRLAELPANFYTKPTLHWGLIAPQKGKYPLMLSYLSGGFSWNVTYNTVWDGKNLLLNSWVTINNTSGRAFENVNLKLIAGEVNKIREQYYDMMQGRAKAGGMAYEMSADAAPAFEEKAFHDFHMYTLDQKVSFANNQTKQIQLFPVKNVTAKGKYEYTTFGDGVQSIINFKNVEEQGLGLPLPKGVIKVYKQDSDKNLEFIGEDEINHTSRNDEVNIRTGKAFDLVAKTIVTDQKSIPNRISERTMKVTVRNNSKETKTIEVIHHTNANSKILHTDRKYETKDNKNTFTLEIAADKEAIIVFTERTEW